MGKTEAPTVAATTARGKGSVHPEYNAAEAENQTRFLRSGAARQLRAIWWHARNGRHPPTKPGFIWIEGGRR